MLFRFTRIVLALAVLAVIWILGSLRRSDPKSAIPPIGARSGPVRILQFYASAGSIRAGQKAKLCYGVENARSVRISPELDDVYPSPNHCLEIVPERTTHYTILAEGYDGALATRSFTLSVQAPLSRPVSVNYAAL